LKTGSDTNYGVPAVAVSYSDYSTGTGGNMMTGVTVASGTCYSDVNNLGDNLSVKVTCSSRYDCVTVFYQNLVCAKFSADRTKSDVLKTVASQNMAGPEWVAQTPQYVPKTTASIGSGEAAPDFQNTACTCTTSGCTCTNEWTAPEYSTVSSGVPTYITSGGTSYQTTVDFQISAPIIGLDGASSGQGLWSRCRGYPTQHRSNEADDSTLALVDVWGIAFGCFIVGLIVAAVAMTVKVSATTEDAPKAVPTAEP